MCISQKPRAQQEFINVPLRAQKVVRVQVVKSGYEDRAEFVHASELDFCPLSNTLNASKSPKYPNSPIITRFGQNGKHFPTSVEFLPEWLVRRFRC